MPQSLCVWVSYLCTVRDIQRVDIARVRVFDLLPAYAGGTAVGDKKKLRDLVAVSLASYLCNREYARQKAHLFTK